VQRLTALASVPVDHEPEVWETNAAGPFMTIGEVGVYALGQDRYGSSGLAVSARSTGSSRRARSRTSSLHPP